MPEPPSSSLVTHYVFENPWPLGLILLAAALVAGWMGLREGLATRKRAALVLGVLGAIVFVLGTMITTAGERGERVVKSLVDAVASEDLIGGMALISDDATMNAGSPQAPGFGYQTIQDRFALLADRYTIESNLVMSMRGYSMPDDEAEVHLTCRTMVEGFPAISNWVVRVKRQSGRGEWKVARLTCISINGETVPIDRAW